jgi:uncharacterized OB-fold protein
MLEATQLQPVVSPAADAAPFWEAAARHTLLLPYCSDCDDAFFYPRILCPRCGGRELAWVEASGAGTLYSFCVHYSSTQPGLADATPFATALVDLDEGVRIMAFLVGVPDDPELITVGQDLTVEFVDLADHQTVLAFRPTSTSPRT